VETVAANLLPEPELHLVFQDRFVEIDSEARRLRDHSSHGRHPSLYGPKLLSGGLPAGLFDGEDDHVHLPARHCPHPGGDAITISSWISPAAADGVILAHGGSFIGYALYLREGRLGIAIRSRPGFASVETDEPLPTGWQHVGGQLTTEGRLSLYVNGIEVASRNDASTLRKIKPGDGIEIGDDKGVHVSSATASHFKGLIRSVTLWHDIVPMKYDASWLDSIDDSSIASVTGVNGGQQPPHEPVAQAPREQSPDEDAPLGQANSNSRTFRFYIRAPNGRKGLTGLIGKFIGLRDKAVVLRRDVDGKEANVPFCDLSEDDQNYVRDQLADDTPPTALHVLRSFRGTLRNAEFSPDGKFLAVSADNEYAVQLFDVKTAKPLRNLKHGQKEGAGSLAFSQDGRYLAALVGTSPNTVFRAWDLENGHKVFDADHQRGSLSGPIAFAADNSMVFAASGPTMNLVHRFQFPSGKQLPWIELKQESVFQITAIAARPNGNLIAVSAKHMLDLDVRRTHNGATHYNGDPALGLHLLHTDSGRQLSTVLLEGEEPDYDLFFHSDGKLLAFGGRDAQSWDPSERHAEALIPKGYHSRGCRMYLARDAQTLLSHDVFARVGKPIFCIWTGPELSLQRSWRETELRTPVALSPDGKLLALTKASRKPGDNELHLYDLSDERWPTTTLRMQTKKLES